MLRSRRALVLAVSLHACRAPEGALPPGAASPDPGVAADEGAPTDAGSSHAEAAPAPEPDRSPEPRALAPVPTADRDALLAAAEPTVEITPVPDGVETRLVLRVGTSSIVLTRAVWDRDRCEDFSHHYAVVDAAHGLVDARLNCHFGEDFWTTEVSAELVVVDVAHAKAEALWSGAETYTGAMGECTTAEGEIEYATGGSTVWQTRASWASWEPQDPREPLVPQSECARPGGPDTRTAVATLTP
jgi:hypothetical protein